MSTNVKILQSGLLLFSLTLLTRLFSLTKNILIADRFGATGTTDAYFVGHVLYNMLIFVTGTSVLAGTASSFFSRNIELNEKGKLDTTFLTILNLSLIVTALVTVLGILYMPEFIRWYVPSFTGESYSLTVKLSRILLPVLIFSGIASYLGATLNAFRNFFVPGFALLLANVVMVCSILLFAGDFGIYSITWGTTAGFALSFLIQLSVIFAGKIRYRPKIWLSYPQVKEFLYKSFPILLMVAAMQAAELYKAHVASEQFTGALSGLQYAAQINDVSINLFIISLLTVLLPEFARDSGKKDPQIFRMRIKYAAEVLIAITLFWSLFIFIFNREIVSVIFQRGEFSAEDSVLTGNLLRIFMIGFIFQASRNLFVYIHLSIKKTWSMSFAGIISYCAQVIFIYLFSRQFGLYGLPLAAVCSTVLFSLLLIWNFRGRYLRFSLIRNSKNLFKIVVSGAFTGLMLFYSTDYFQFDHAAAILYKVGHLALLFSGSAVLYAVLLQVTGVFPLYTYVKSTFGKIYGN